MIQEVKLHSRIKFPEGKQRQFLQEANAALNMKNSELAKIAGVHARTFRDWKREKNNISFLHLFSICYKMKVDIPKGIEILPPYWSVKKASKLGGRRYVELYGAPGTMESRRRGWLKTQEKFRLNPEYAKKIGFVQRKKIKCPKKSSALAEFIGIMLGDGGISSNYQLTVSFNPKLDIEYAHYVQKLITKLFSISSAIKIREKYGNANVVVSGRNLIEFLHQHGIEKGNKVAKQVDIPKWIWDSREYKIGCLRGLIDTDGCFYKHSYTVNGKEYTYIKMCFTNYSQPLLKSVTTILKDLGFRPKNTAKNRVYLYTLDQIKKYFGIIGTKNTRYFNFYRKFITNYE